MVDLGSGTGQLAVPLVGHCAAVLAVEPEPEMLRGLRARGVARLACVLGSDSDMPLLNLLLMELGRTGGLASSLRAVLDEQDPVELVEDVTTTAVIGRRPS